MLKGCWKNVDSDDSYIFTSFPEYDLSTISLMI